MGNRDVRQLLWHRHRLVQMRTRVQNQLQAIALNAGIRRKKRLWSQAGREQLQALALPPALVKKVVWISSSGSLETGLKHGVELVKDGGDVLGHAFPSALFQGRDGETKFELERIL